MAANTIVGVSDPSVARQVERQTSQQNLVAGNRTTVITGNEVIYNQALATVGTTPNANSVTITQSANNDTGDITTVYSTPGTISVTSVDQRVNQYSVYNTGVSQIIAGNNITISSTIANGKGEVTINATGGGASYGNSNVVSLLASFGSNTISTTGNVSVGNISATNLGNIVGTNYDGNSANVLHGDGSWSADTTTYGNSNVVTLLGAFGSNTIVTTGNITAGNANLGNLITANYANLAFDLNANVVDANYLYGDGSNITNLPVGNIASINLDGNASNVLRGDGTFGADANSSYGDSNVATLLGSFGSNNISTTGNISVGDLNVTGNVTSSLLPNANVTYDLGSNTQRWNDIWLANSTIYLGDATLSANGNSIVVDSITVTNGNVGTVGNVAALNLDGSSSNVLYGNGVFAPGGGGGNTGDFIFANTTMSTPDEDIMLIQTTDNNSDLRTQMRFNPDLGQARMAARSAENNTNYTNTSWTIGEYTSQQVNFVDAPAIVAFLNTGAWNSGVDKTFSINGGNRLSYQGYSAGGNNATVYTDVSASPDPTTVTSIDFYYQLESKFEIDEDDGDMGIYSTGLTIRIDNDQTDGPDIFINSGDDITIQAKSKTLGSESEGGDINIYAGAGAGDDGAGNVSSTGGDIQIYAGAGGFGNSGTGSEGGFTRIRAGTGGDAGVSSIAGDGGYVEISAGSGGYNNGNIQLGAIGGHVDIYAGQTTLANTVGGNVSIRSGEGGDSAIAGNVQIITPSSGPGGGGTWTFDGNGLLTLPGGDVQIGTQYGSPSILASNVAFGIVSQGSSGMSALQWNDDVSNVSQISSIYINDPTGNVGDIQVRTGPAGNANVWIFGSDGLLTLPEGAIIDTLGNNFEVRAVENVNFEANAVVNIYTDGSGNAYQWQFGDDGILNLAGGNSTIQSVANNAGDLSGLSTLNLVPDSTTGDDRYIIVDPTGPNHIHIRAGGAQDGSNSLLFLGGEQAYVQIDDTVHEVQIGAYDNANAISYFWRFENDGTLTLPGNLVASGASPAPTLSGFSSLSAADVIAVGNANIYSNGHIAANTASFSGNVSGDVALFNDLNLNNLGTNSFLYTDSNRDVYDTQFSYDTATDTMSGGNISLTGNITATNIGNISGVNLDGSSSNVLYGNGVFAQPASIPFVLANANITANINTSYQVLNSVGNANINFTLPDGNGLAAGSFVKINPYDQSLGNFAYFVVTNGANSGGIQGLAAPLSANRPTTLVWGGSFWYYSN